MKKIYFFILSAVYSRWLQAQENARDIDVATDTNNGNWYASPWLWIAGAAIFILFLVALTRGKKE